MRFRWMLLLAIAVCAGAEKSVSPRVFLVGDGDRVLKAEQVTTVDGREQFTYRDAEGRVVDPPPGMAAAWAWRSRSVESMQADISPADRVKKAKPYPDSARAGVTSLTARVRLGAVNQSALRAEDEAGGRDGSKPTRIGVRRQLGGVLDSSAYQSRWLKLPDGRRVMRIGIESDGAEGLRVHLEDVLLPPGAYVLVYSADDLSDIQGPYPAESFAGAGEKWTETVFSSRVIVECVLPAGFAADAARLKVREVAHLYRRLDDVIRKAAGYCNNDISCSPAWKNTGNGVAGLGSIGRAGVLFCTGCLLNDSDGTTDTSYFMTAFHCLDDNPSVANTLEFYWFYQTATCNGTPPNPAQVPRTGGGAVFLAAQNDWTGNDFCFLRLRQTPPGGVTYNGWSTAPIANNQGLVGIHHPDGDYKRISSGQLSYSDANFHYVRWSSGITEPGSSGSPLFNLNQQFVGQLLGGESSCSLPNALDYYGRFDVSYPVIRSYLSSLQSFVILSADRRDFDGDGRTDVGVYHPAAGNWYVRRSSNTQLALTQWGWSAAQPAVGDFDGDGISDIAVYHPATGNWYIRRSSNGQLQLVQWGWSAAVPVPGRYDADAASDIAVFHQASATWYIRQSSNGQLFQQQWGWSETLAVPGDYDGDGRTDIGVFHPASGVWYIRRSSNGQLMQQTLGGLDTQPAPGDYDGDGVTDFAAYQPQSGDWTIRRSSNSQTQTVNWGWSAAQPVPGRFDADAASDVTVYHPATGNWYIRQSNAGNALLQLNWGWSAAIPLR